MIFKMNTCFYEQEGQSVFSNGVDFESLKTLGFNPNIVKGGIQGLLEFMSSNKVDIWVVNLVGIDKERFSCIYELIYNNFCKNILLISDDIIDKKEFVPFLNISDLNNFDLKLKLSLMDIKRGIELNPARNLALIRAKVYNILDSFQFSSRHDGFLYYLDAIIIAYKQLPKHYSTMQIYKEVGKMHNKSSFAVEKSMRMALMYAFNKLKGAEKTPENADLKAHLTYDLNNNTAISMMLSRLIMDQDIKNAINYKEYLTVI